MSSPEGTVLFLAWPQFDACEAGFWRRLDAGLRQQGMRLVLASAAAPPPDLGVCHIPAVPNIDTFWPGADGSRHLVDELGLDVDALLAREAAWGAPSILPDIERHRRQAIEHTAGHWLRTLLLMRPAAVVIWNGQHVAEMVLAAACRYCGVPVMYVERAPVPQALFADEAGLSAASSIAGQSAWTVPQARWRDTADAIVNGLRGGRSTWWEQPPSRTAGPIALRHQLGVPDGPQVLLFAGQVDEDTQQFLFSPHFDSNLEAFRWFLDQLRGRDGVFVLGKQHPKSRVAAAAYQQALASSGVPGTWREDVSIDDALAVADRVAAVNSTVLYEALARERPVLSMGKWLLSGRGAGYEVVDRIRSREVVSAWLSADDFSGRHQAWLESLAFLLSASIYTYHPQADAGGMMGACDLAGRIRHLAESSHGWFSGRALDAWLATEGRSTSSWRVPGDQPDPPMGLDWQRAHALRHQLIAVRDAAGEGRRVVIWGTGVAGRLVHRLLREMGVCVAAFVASEPDAPQVCGTPVTGPSALAAGSGDVIAVASLAAHEIEPALRALGFAAEKDYILLDCTALARMCDTLAMAS